MHTSLHTLDHLRSGALAGTRRLNLSCGLEAMPAEVFDLADTLEVLNLSGNQLRSLPHDLPRLHRLKVIFCSDNPFAVLPEVLGDCTSLQVVGFKACRVEQVPDVSLPPGLRWLILTDNAVSALPASLGERPALQKLMLAGNQLRALPESLAQAHRLELIRLAANQLAQLPAWLTDLPRLAWLALSGNPLGWQLPQYPALESVPWSQLQVGKLLGEGASGHIYQADMAHRAHLQRHGTVPPNSLALKLFKGAVTSDGLPEHELAACLAAGQHPALCTPSGMLADHPQGAQGLLLPLIPASHINLAGPPSLESCTRDVYPASLPGPHIDAALALQVATHIAGAVAHLHQQGVMHGDLYAHNILWNPANGDALLSDFGAATLLPVDQPVVRRSLQALEVRALGYLLQELHAHAQPNMSKRAQHAGALQGLAHLAEACLALVPADRPDAVEVVRQLRGM